MSTRIGHKAIRASAGTGKTHTLVARYLRLLANGADPSAILALTFTRMAAGEFLEKIFARLLAASGSVKEAGKLAGEIGAPKAEPDFFGQLLQTLVHSIGDLQLLTIDSFFARIVAAFPFELGLTQPHVILQDYALAEARREVLRGLLNRTDEEGRQQLLRIFKERTFGREEKNVVGVLTETLNNSYPLFLEAGGATKWGEVRSIYGNRKPWWLAEKEIDRHRAADEVRGELAGMEEFWGKRLYGNFAKMVDNLESWTMGKRLPGGSILEQLLVDPTRLGRERYPLAYHNKDYEIPPELGKAVLRLLQSVLGAEFVRCLFETRAVGSLLALYDEQYGASVRDSGLLVFQDLPVLLLRALAPEEGTVAGLDFAYRLDQRVDHWLIDEFQDTSRLQWRVLEPLVAEALMDPEQRRSFFYVGDVKQSLYGWRGGDARLFDEVLHSFPGEGGGGIKAEPLHQSYRSAWPVLQCVNAVFGREGPLPGLPLLPGVKERWNANWEDHEPAAPVARKNGFAGIFATDAEDSAPAIVDLLRQLDPEGRGLRCAVLCRKNRRVRELTLSLREAGFHARMEGKAFPGNDNVLGLWIQAFFRWIEQPENRFLPAWMQMTGAGGEPETLHALLRQVRALLSGGGVPAAVRRLLEEWAAMIAECPFLQRRATDLIEAAIAFTELRHGGSPRRFGDYLNQLELDESGEGEGIQVLTIHKAKGLDFDVVVVADMAKQELMSSQNRDFHVERASDGSIRWIAELPAKEILASDPVLRGARERLEAEQQFESLCNLYVAMTRAKQGLYILSTTKDFAAGGKVVKYNALLGLDGPRPEGSFPAGLALKAGFGDPEWFRREEAPPVKPLSVPRLRPLDGTPAPRYATLRSEPSPSAEAHGHGELPRELLSRGGARFGTKVHAFLAAVEWLGPEGQAAEIPGWEALEPSLRQRLASFFASKWARQVFAKPQQAHQLWREKPFILRDQNRLRAGIIDRAVVLCSEDGQPEKVRIYDFKTDQLQSAPAPEEQLRARYSRQLERYREAAIVLTGLPAERIEVSPVPV